jgi:hypothetical protein
VLANTPDPALKRLVTARAIEKLAQPEALTRTEHMPRPFAVLLEPNPRAMKRFVNAYGVRESIDLLQETYTDPVQLARRTLLELRWPLLAEELERKPELLERIGQRCARLGVGGSGRGNPTVVAR